MKFLDWDLIDFIDRSIYSRNIAEIAQIDVQSDTVNASFALTHLRDQTDANKNLRDNGDGERYTNNRYYQFP